MRVRKKHSPEFKSALRVDKLLLAIVFLVRGIEHRILSVSFEPECDVCGKKNLKMTIVIEDEAGELLHYGSDCASRTLRQDYQGKRHPISREAAISMGRSAKRGDSFARLSQQVTA